MRYLKFAPASAAAALVCCGCASVVEKSVQTVQVATAPENGAQCSLSNERGKWLLVSPGVATVEKSASVLLIDCIKPGYQEAKLYVEPKISTAATVGMMLPYVGLLSAAADAESGAGQKYPDNYVVNMKPIVAPPQATAPTVSTPASNQTKGNMP